MKTYAYAIVDGRPMVWLVSGPSSGNYWAPSVPEERVQRWAELFSGTIYFQVEGEL